MISFTVEDEQPDVTKFLAGQPISYPWFNAGCDAPRPERTNLRAHLIKRGLLRPPVTLKMDTKALQAAMDELEDHRLRGAYADRGVTIWGGQALHPRYDD